MEERSTRSEPRVYRTVAGLQLVAGVARSGAGPAVASCGTDGATAMARLARDCARDCRARLLCRLSLAPHHAYVAGDVEVSPDSSQRPVRRRHDYVSDPSRRDRLEVPVWDRADLDSWRAGAGRSDSATAASEQRHPRAREHQAVAAARSRPVTSLGDAECAQNPSFPRDPRDQLELRQPRDALRSPAGHIYAGGTRPLDHVRARGHRTRATRLVARPSRDAVPVRGTAGGH